MLDLVADGYETSELADADKALLRLVDAFHSGTCVNDEDRASLRTYLSDEQILERALWAFATSTLARILITTGVEPERAREAAIHVFRDDDVAVGSDSTCVGDDQRD